MDWLINFFSAAGDFILGSLKFFWGLLMDLLYVVGLLLQISINLPDYFSWLPGEVLSIIIVTFGVVVVYKILGREG